MTKRLSAIFVLCLLIVAFLAVEVLHATKADMTWVNRLYLVKHTKMKLAGAERPSDYAPPGDDGGSKALGFDEVTSASPGITVGTSSYDLQSNTRMNRQIDWRATQMIHIIWMRSTSFDQGSLDRGTAYEAWDDEETGFIFAGDGGGCDIHARLGPGANYSGYVGLDVDTEGKVVIGNHHDMAAGWATTVWYDYLPASCFFESYRRRIDTLTMQYGVSPEQIASGEYRFIWPQMEYQVFGGDTVTHVFSMQTEDEIDPSFVHYFRRVGSDTVGAWDYPPMIVDTIPTISQSVSASRSSGKVALIWQATPPEIPGGGESRTLSGFDEGGLGTYQRTNDVYYMMSQTMGSAGSWGPKVNVTGYDSSQGGWLGGGDMSVLIDTDDYLHIVWPARQVVPLEGHMGDFTFFYGSRMLHWDELNDEVRPVKDANWDILDPRYVDSACTGGAWNQMSLAKPMISECDGKFYCIFVQFNDYFGGVYNDCNEFNFSASMWNGTANGELYISVSDNGGYNWDIARNLTNTPTPHCDTSGTPYECESDHYPSVSRFGMDMNNGGDYSGVPIVDPSGEYSGTFYLDVFYLNDKFPGSCMQNAGIWTTNPFKWFRVPCVNPEPNPVLAYSPLKIQAPTWTKPSIEITKPGKLENIGNAPLTINTVTTINPDDSPADWLAVSPNLDGIGISHLSPNYYDFTLHLNAGGAVQTGPVVMEGYVVIQSNSVGGSTDSIHVKLIVADSVQFPEEKDIRTACKRIVFSNAGNIGGAGGAGGDGGYNLNFFDDCDTSRNRSGLNDHAGVYLYEASPFVAYIKGDDTVLNYYIHGADWLSDDGFRPIEGNVADSTTYSDYQYGYSGQFLSKDSTIGLECEYFAPSHPDTCSFIVMKQRIYNLTQTTIGGVFVGDFMDWDIPADTGTDNESGFDASRQLMYCWGHEYAPDTLSDGTPDEVNDCVLADQRYGGFSYYGGFKAPYRTEADSLYETKAMWSESNARYLYPAGGFVPELLYKMMVDKNGYELYYSDDPDSEFVDLHLVTVFGQHDLGAGDTLVFVKILATEYNGGETAFKATVDMAKAWIAARPEIFTWPERTGCCDTPGDANNSGGVNILDVTKIINYLYKGADPPPCNDEADANGSNGINILDVTRIINYLYKGGDAPVCGTTGT